MLRCQVAWKLICRIRVDDGSPNDLGEIYIVPQCMKRMGTIVLDSVFVLVQYLLIIFGQTTMPNWTLHIQVQFDRTTRGHDLHIRKNHSNVDARKFHFCNRIINIWNNCLSAYQVHLRSVSAFKRSLVDLVF